MLNRVIFLLGLNFTRDLFACASCGSSGDDPLVLYPNEVYKALIQISQGTNYQNIDSDGDFRSSGGTECKVQGTVSFGAAFSHKSFATVTKSYIENRRGEKSKQGFGDWSVAGRYSLLMLSIDDEVSPQIQLLYGYKHSSSQSTRSSSDPYLLDVFGSGFSEVKAGIDVWWGQWTVKPGFAVSVVKPLPRSIRGVDYTPGNIFRFTSSLAYFQPSYLKWVAGVTTERKLTVELSEGQAIPSALTNSFFLTAEGKVNDVDMIRLTYSETGTIGTNYNTYSSKNLTGAFIHLF